MKSYIILFITIILITGCGTSGLTTPLVQDQTDVRNASINKIIKYSDEVPIIGLISKYDGDPFLDLVLDTAESILYEKGYHVVRKSPHSYMKTVDEQNIIMKEFILSDVDGIIIIPNDVTQLNDVIGEALNNNIPVVIVDTPVDIEALFAKGVNEELLSLVQIDNYQAAYSSASIYFETLDFNSKSMIISGDINNPNAIERRNGVVQAIKESSKIELIEIIDGGWQEHLAYNITIKQMYENPDINMIICSNDRMAMGSIFALKELELLESVIVTGFDGTADAMVAIEKGEVGFTVNQEPTDFGIYAAEALIEIITLGKTDRYHFVDTELFMKGNK